ncbi:MAG: preprotein translocase subunit SecY [Actinomyces sp.]|nr:preprotein translocase subunit SecY [Actinomyces sp.]MCI1641351.1 preprotein translocase subunit SecY [Actinomyces sp.]MCI1662229.1 preprotein translocase subunit SecY [Actinomyces sp.]MCI1691020.1 preprotein translocase subunit SecY [Actinomyces sp.]MCI1787505.1 preprotein translocase subunit SecY [Actinomyces sp.]MCI1829225.1 preprotein translocase subunit SecY [Actinomyces sp.]
MLSAFAQAFRTPDLRRKLLFTLFIMAVYRLGCFIPTPGVDSQAVQACLVQEDQTGLLDLVNLFSGGALLQLSLFALGIMPYITASIIIQLLRVVIPRFDDLHKEGQTGQSTLTQYTRYLTIGLGLLQSTTMISLARSGNMFPGCSEDVIADESVTMFLVMIIVMTAGTAVIMWLGELVTERGVGNGMSILIFTSITARMPAQLLEIGQGGSWGKVGLIVVMILLVAAAVVFVEQAQRRIPVQYAKRMVGRRMYGGSTTYIPLKINMSGVIPVIFASSLLAIPGMVAQFGQPTDGWVQWISANLGQQSWGYLTLYALMILGFAFFYTSITFNPDEVADNMKRYGGFIPGYRAGRPTAEYLRFVINRITTAGAVYLVVIALIPSLLMIPLNLTNGQLPFGGTTLLIIVGVGLQTVKEINTQLQQHHYEGFLR